MPGIIPPEFHVDIPRDRIALYPPEKRGDSKLLVIDRSASRVVHVGPFWDITRFVTTDLIVINETKVVPARVFGHRVTGGSIELLFLVTSLEPQEPTQPSSATCARVCALLSTSRPPRPGTVIILPEEASFAVEGRSPHGGWEGVWTSSKGDSFEMWLDRVGVPPLPPYIKRAVEPSDREWYQTVYAEKPGSIAAPTAGLHFTNELLQQLQQGGADIAKLTLDVGWGTFEPIKTADLTRHVMHRESFHIPESTAKAVNSAKSSARNILAVGTTSVRALEATALAGLPIRAGEGDANLFIYPPYKFKVVDKLLTNFHRPDSTLIQLVAAMIGWDLLNEAYQRALDEDFRFYSYGDVMLIL